MLAEFRLHNTDCHAHYRYGIRKVYGAVTVDIGKRQGLFGNVSQIKRVAHDCDCIRNGNSAVTVNSAHDTVCSVNSGYGAVGGCTLLTVLICLSTLFLKQHSVVDVLCGIALTVLLHLAVTQLYRKFSRSSSTTCSPTCP